MSLDQFISTASQLLRPILGEKGAVLYSSASTLSRGDVYVLGLNPGGDPTKNTTTVGSSLTSLPNYTENAYLDEDWSNHKQYGKGQHPLQRNMQLLCDGLGYNLRDVCASNLIFLQSRDQYGARFTEMASMCWAVHRLVIDIVSPSTLIVFGTGRMSPYSHLLLKKTSDEQRIPSGHGSWTCGSFFAQDEHRKFKVVALPHLSRYSLDGRIEVIEWLKKEAQN